MSLPSYRSAALTVFRRELQLAWRKPSQVVQPVIFFLIVVTLFPLGISPAPQTLALIAPGVIWIAALLAIMMTVEGLFKQDYINGTIEQWLLSVVPMPVIVLAKLVASWITSCLSLIILSPLLALLMNMESAAIPGLIVSLLIGTPILLLIGAIGNALTVGLNGAGVLLSLLVLPLYIPVLIFATGLIEAASMNMNYSGHAAILASMLMLTLLLAPLAIAAALKNTVN